MPKQKYKQRKDGRYATTFHGKPIYGKTSKELEDKINELNYFYNTGKPIGNDKLSFKEWAEKWYDLNMKTKEKNTQNLNRTLLDCHIYPEIGLISIKNLKKYNVENLIKNMELEGIKVTANKSLALIKRILQDAVDNDIVSKNVASNIKCIKIEKEPKKPLSVYEDKIFLQVAQEHKDGCFMMLLRYCGLRREEAVPLVVNDIDLDNKKLFINKAVYFGNNQSEIKSTKNKKSRVVTIPDILIPFLKSKIEGRKGTDLIFIKKTSNEMLSLSSLRRSLESFLYHCNLLHEKTQKELDKEFVLTDDNKISFTFHQLRHSYCTMLYYADVKIKKAQELMGHSSADMVYDIYTHLDEERENAEDLINTYISNKYV